MVSKEYLNEKLDPKDVKGKELCVCPKCGHKVPKNENTPCPKYKCTKCGQQMVQKGKDGSPCPPGKNPCPEKKEK